MEPAGASAGSGQSGFAVAMVDESVKLRAVSDYDEPPRLKGQTRPEYPKAAHKAKIQGTVVLSFAVDEAGRVSWWRIEESIPELDEAAIACITKWTFAPAQRKGVPVAAVLKAPIEFKIY